LKTLLILLISSTASAQVQWLQEAGPVGKQIEALTGEIVSGSPYLFGDYYPGLVYMNRVIKPYRVEKLKYNIAKERIIYEEDDRELYLEPMLFRKFLIITGNDTLSFQNNIEGLPFGNQSYAMVLYSGKNTWVKKYTKKLVTDPNVAFGVTDRKAYSMAESFYIITEDKEAIEFKPGKKFVKKSYPNLSTDFNDFVKNENISFDDDKDLKKICEWLDARI